LKSKHECIETRNEHCDVCHLAKQKKLSFPNSISHIDKCFNLIHVDIWGPAPTPSMHGHEIKMNEFFSSKGIIHQTSCVETPEQNGIAERKHLHLLNVTRALIFQSKVSTQLWSYALTHVAFLISITPTPFLQNSTLYEK